MSRPDAKPPAILVGGQTRMVLAVAASLARRGIPVVHAPLGASEGDIGSRRIVSTVRLPNWLEEPAATEAALADLAMRWPGAVLIPLNDSATLALARLRGRLPAGAVAATAPAESVALAQDKARLRRRAEELGIPVPREFTLASRAEAAARSGELRFPLFAKVGDKLARARRHGHADFGVRKIPDGAALEACWVAEPDFGAEWLLQEFCPGHDVLLAVLMHRGEMLAAFQSRSLRTWPSTGGLTVLAEAEPVDAEWRERIGALLRAIGWEGIAQADLRRDPATGRTVLLEINGRCWGSIAAAIHAGVDFPWYVWQLARGEIPRPPAAYPAGGQTHWAMGDLKRLTRLLRAPDPADSPARALGRLLWACRPGVRGMMWHWDDPWPAVREWTGNVRWFLHAAAKRLRDRLPPRRAR